VINVGAGEELPVDVDLVFEASGAAATLGAVLHATARGRHGCPGGNLPGKAVAASLGDLVTREISWIGSYRFVDEITDAVAAMENGLDVTPLITHRYPINEAEHAITVAADRNSGSGKVLLQLG
jgi:L-idonate 5-dehydrogenase